MLYSSFLSSSTYVRLYKKTLYIIHYTLLEYFSKNNVYIREVIVAIPVIGRNSHSSLGCDSSQSAIAVS